MKMYKSTLNIYFKIESDKIYMWDYKSKKFLFVSPINDKNPDDWVIQNYQLSEKEIDMFFLENL